MAPDTPQSPATWVTALPPLPPLAEQARRIVALGLHDLAGLPEEAIHAAAESGTPGALLVIHPDRLFVSTLAPLLRHAGKPGFVVTDMEDVDRFQPISAAETPAAALYLVLGLDRGDHLADWSPVEALPAILAAGRTPLTLAEGIQWVLHQPEALDRNRCFMTIGSRLSRSNGMLDARTPAIWISNGTGRDGAERRHAPKVGWCWAGNRHTWLGFASATERRTSLQDAPRKDGAVGSL